MELTPDLRRRDQRGSGQRSSAAEWAAWGAAGPNRNPFCAAGSESRGADAVPPGHRAARISGFAPERLIEPDRHGGALDRGLFWLLAASLLGHLCFLVAFALLGAQQPEIERARETPVDVIIEKPPTPPTPPEKAAAPPESQKPPTSPVASEKAPAVQKPEPRTADAKPPEPSASEAKPPETKPPAQKTEGAKDARIAAADQKAAARKSAAAKRAEAKPESEPADARSRPSSAAAQKEPRGVGAAAAQASHATLQSDDFGPRSGPPGGLRLPFDNGPPLFRAIAVPLPTEGGEEAMSYKIIVFGMLERAKRYPDAARERGARGSAVVTFTIDDAGELTNVSLFQSSGDAELDVESLALVARAAPFPKPPPDAQHEFAAEIAFGLERAQ